MNSVSIVLVEPENAHNIGAVARAMKNMELDDLRLINPPEDWLKKGRIMAVDARDVLASAKAFTCLRDAVSDAGFVLGTSRRHGGRRRAFMEFDEAMLRITGRGDSIKSAVVFGKESKGLSNADLSLCDWYTMIPVNPGFPSINLAQAVMIVCYSLYRKFQAAGKATPFAITPPYEELDYVSKKEFEEVLDRFCEAVRHLEYKPEVTARIRHAFRNMLKRSGLLKSEGKMIKGVSRRVLERTFPKYKKTKKTKHPD